GADDNEVGRGEGIGGALRRTGVGRIDAEVHDPAVMLARARLLAEERAADGDLALQLRAVGERGPEADVVERRRVDVAGDLEDLRRREDGVVEAAGDARQRREQEVAERMPAERFAALEAETEELREELLFL